MHGTVCLVVMALAGAGAMAVAFKVLTFCAGSSGVGILLLIVGLGAGAAISIVFKEHVSAGRCVIALVGGDDGSSTKGGLDALASSNVFELMVVSTFISSAEVGNATSCVGGSISLVSIVVSILETAS